MKLTLHHYWRSSSSWRVRWALALKGIVYDSNAIDLLKGAQNDPSQVARSPFGYVPCLEVDGRPLSESVAIIEWLEETQPTPALFPRDPWARARVRQLVEMVNAGIQPLQNLVVSRHVASDLEAQKTWMRHWIQRGLDAVERELAIIEAEGHGGRHAVGGSVTAAELFIIPQLYNARRQSLDVTKWPKLAAIEAAALETDAAKMSHPDRFQPQ
ncbi:MAG: maleylacetoacetate isomerase [Polyangiales bacterium]